MKKTTLFSAIILAVVLVIGLAFTSFAADDGTITVSGTSEGQVYNAYIMAELASVSGSNYSYKIVPEWEQFFAEQGIAFDPTTKYITYNGNITDIAAFAVSAVKYASDKSIAPAKTATVAAGETSVKIDGLALGYYCVDSTVGTVCALTTTNKDASFAEKNPPPSIVKQVKEDSRGTYGPQNDDSIGKTIEYRTTVIKRAGAINYIITDTMSKGLTFNPSSVNLYYVDSEENTTDLPLSEAGLKHGTTLPIEYSDRTFIIELDNSEIQSLADGTRIILEYTATLNEDAVIAGEGNPNETTIVYGRDPQIESEPSKTTTYVWAFGVYKYELVSGAKSALAGAKFQLLSKAADTTETIHTFDDLGVVDGVHVYRYNPSGTTTEFVSDSTGLFKIIGIDSGDFFLRETEAPEGYNKITYDIEVDLMITGDYLDATHAIALTVKGANTDGNIEVQNSTGVILPSTGSTGTVILVAVGLTLVIAMGVLLVVKKRMSKVVFTR